MSTNASMEAFSMTSDDTFRKKKPCCRVGCHQGKNYTVFLTICIIFLALVDGFNFWYTIHLHGKETMRPGCCDRTEEQVVAVLERTFNVPVNDSNPQSEPLSTDGEIALAGSKETLAKIRDSCRGPKGFKGETGVKGDKGQIGSNGIHGEKGEQGVQGPPGQKGSPGIPGLRGNTGQTGPVGPIGTKGASGNQGVQGAPGLHGVKGDTGRAGNPGAKGDQGGPGNPGAKGNIGDPGISGSKGDKGDIGRTGSVGLPGGKGSTGNQGLKGIQGVPGSPGSKGDRGNSGASGSPGSEGSQGVQGLPGSKGDQGSPGNPGGQGSKGSQGIPGSSGLKGDQGVAGSRGVKGEQGPFGSPGLVGSKGQSGAKGDAGLKGEKGEIGIGTKGAKGSQGLAGAKGENGEPSASASSSSFNYTCSFENQDLCGYTQSTSDNFDWTVHRGFTGSFGTGPIGAANGTWYIYIETSSSTTGSEATLISPLIPANAGLSCVKFHYHMYGITIGTLRVIQSFSDGRTSVVFTETGNQGDQWFWHSGSLSGNTPYQILFTATKGASYYGDISLDLISVHSGTC